MGNRAVITNKEQLVGIYLHWNGGRDSVEAFLKYCQIQGFRGFGVDDTYAFGRLVQIISNFIGGGLSVGINSMGNLDCDNGDNGVYMVNDWNIIGRSYAPRTEQSGYDLNEVLDEINKCQPEEYQKRFSDWKREELEKCITTK